MSPTTSSTSTITTSVYDLLPGYSRATIDGAISSYTPPCRGFAYQVRGSLAYIYEVASREGAHQNCWTTIRADSPEALADSIKGRIGTRASGDLWDTWMAQIEEMARRTRDMRALLRYPAGREACRQAAEAGKKYSADAEQYALRPVVRQAVSLLTARKARKHVPESPAPGRIARLADARRLARTREEVLIAAAYRTARNGHGDTVQFGSPEATCGGGTCRPYCGSYKTWSALVSHHTYTVPRDWLEAVCDRDLECCDGMLTLDARPIQGVGPELYEAVWVEQGAGTGLNTVRGYLARIDTTTYHAATARAALDGVQRKAGLKPARRKGVVDLDRLARRHGDLPVYWSDREGIACVSGSRSWCRAVGIDPTETTVAELVRGYKLRPMPEVLQVIRRVVRSGRSAVSTTLDLTPPSALEGTGRVVFDAEGGFRILPSDLPSDN